MVYEFAKYPDETLVVFSDIRKKDNGEEYIRVSFERPTENGFDTVVFELPSYEIVEKDCNIEPKNMLFIDDSKENIEVANKRGWNTCLATGHELDKIKDSINNFLNI